ncbi:uncharacterized protein LOC112565220 [Pomacea canaliculata]|uniref:uncharacterized protein LOC112565220 n=1 Tax=Pomacea canaliculata TaxID=400727 RepID=UPI000D728A14|nr:uncharacterized protein LOC112565220 [Pomacea canaliculata]
MMNTCSCQAEEGVIDLSPLASDDGPAFKDLLTPELEGWRYAWNPCKSFTLGTCKNAAGCEYYQDGTQYTKLGTQESAQFVTDSGSLQLYYNNTKEGSFRGLTVTLTCDPAVEKNVTVQVTGSPVAGLTLTSKYCCPQHNTFQLSIGSILDIAFAGLLVVYIVGGIVFQVGVRKSSGKEIIPNYSWWSSLPALIKDGMKFTFTCGRSDYNKF